MARGLIVAFALAISGCSAGPASLDSQSVIDGLPISVLPDGPEFVTDVACPAPAPEVVEQELVCTARLHDRPITIDVAIEALGVGTVAVRELLLDLSEVADELGRRLSADLGLDVEAECPGIAVVVRPGAGFVCTAAHEDRPLELAGTIDDDEGNWSVALVD